MQNSDTNSDLMSVLDIALDIVDEERNGGLLEPNEKVPYIPELVNKSRSICVQVLKAINEEKDEFLSHPVTILTWGAFTGIGAVALWYKDKKAAQENGIAATLLFPDGAMYLDAEVMLLVDQDPEKEEGKQWWNSICDVAKKTFKKYLTEVPDEQYGHYLFDAMCAMYVFGTIYQMENLGMK